MIVFFVAQHIHIIDIILVLFVTIYSKFDLYFNIIDDYVIIITICIITRIGELNIILSVVSNSHTYPNLTHKHNQTLHNLIKTVIKTHSFQWTPIVVFTKNPLISFHATINRLNCKINCISNYCRPFHQSGQPLQ